MLLELGDLLLADRLQVVIQGVSPNDLDQVFHRVQDFNVFALRARTRGTSEKKKSENDCDTPVAIAECVDCGLR